MSDLVTQGLQFFLTWKLPVLIFAFLLVLIIGIFLKQMADNSETTMQNMIFTGIVYFGLYVVVIGVLIVLDSVDSIGVWKQIWPF